VDVERILFVEICFDGALSRHRQRCVPSFSNENIFAAGDVVHSQLTADRLTPIMDKTW
jgi:hypothetical protein